MLWCVANCKGFTRHHRHPWPACPLSIPISRKKTFSLLHSSPLPLFLLTSLSSLTVCGLSFKGGFFFNFTTHRPFQEYLYCEWWTYTRSNILTLLNLFTTIVYKLSFYVRVWYSLYSGIVVYITVSRRAQPLCSLPLPTKSTFLHLAVHLLLVL